jgi:hypothetical protein
MEQTSHLYTRKFCARACVCACLYIYIYTHTYICYFWWIEQSATDTCIFNRHFIMHSLYCHAFKCVTVDGVLDWQLALLLLKINYNTTESLRTPSVFLGFQPTHSGYQLSLGYQLQLSNLTARIQQLRRLWRPNSLNSLTQLTGLDGALGI